MASTAADAPALVTESPANGVEQHTTPTAAVGESQVTGNESGEESLDDIFDDNDDLDDYDPDGKPSNVSRNFNRQQPLISNQSSKPAANTSASVDDQIAALSKHAGKIRLDDVKGDEYREKDKADRATSDQVLDRRTRMILLQMINRNTFSEMHGAISTGKEANVYGAVAYPDINGPAVQRAIKVYKTAILSFKDRERYITGEHRFKMGADKGNNRKMVKLWAEKEFRNLRRIHMAGIACPEPISLKIHVMVMSFLGDKKGYAYPRLRDAVIPAEGGEEVWQRLYIQLLGIMRRMYQVCRLVHADLSEYNILYNKQQLYIIDVSQSVEHDHPRSLEFLRMDIKNTGDFFRRQGVETLSDRVVFDFIMQSQGPVEEPALADTIKNLYENAPEELDDESAAAKQQVDNEVFRNQYIPQTLDQVYDIEKDAQKIDEGEKLVYHNLLADQVTKGKDPQASGSEEEDGESEEGTSSGSDDDGEEGDEFTKGPPRGKRFEDKDEKKQHKQAVKEAKREKRKEKMPKHLKKKIVATTSRKKR